MVQYGPAIVLRPSGRYRPSSTLRVRILPPRFLTPLYAFGTSPSGMPQPSCVTIPPYRASDELRAEEWPEENLASTTEEEGGFYPVRLGETFDGHRFVITRKLGWGKFSTVWLARDHKEDRHVAIKILSAHASKELQAGQNIERDALRTVSSTSPLHPGFKHVIHLFHEFTFESFAGQHICFVTDVLSFSAPDLRKYLGDSRLSLRLILCLVKHVLKALEYLHDECKLVHTDLKPENILLLPSDLDKIVMHELSGRPAAIYGFQKNTPPNELPFHPVFSAPLSFTLETKGDSKMHWIVADMGHAQSQREHMRGMAQPYALRAPEVILGLSWGPAIDIWSLGCLMYEFATGNWLFDPSVINDIPRGVVHLAQMSQRTGQDHDDVVLEQYEIREKQYDLKGMMKRAIAGDAHLASIESEFKYSTIYSDGSEEVAPFLRIMRSFLALDPSRRPCAAEALLDPAFEDIY